jgi:hypothetical protein
MAEENATTCVCPKMRYLKLCSQFFFLGAIFICPTNQYTSHLGTRVSYLTSPFIICLISVELTLPECNKCVLSKTD